MKRKVLLEEISDGKLYEANDLVKTGCGGCEGCSACCRGMGNSVTLDPLDLFQMGRELKKNFAELLAEAVELTAAEGVIYPSLRMREEDDACVFLNEQGRCRIHPFRPGVCRLFPLGRYYAGDGIRYFLQLHECPRENRTKVKVKNWIDVPDLRSYEAFVQAWHEFLNGLEASIKENPDPEYAKNMNLYMLNTFYAVPFDEGADFYEQFKVRLEEARENLGI
jgi:Fe-S-cluster containining protein